jgi:GDP-L-fucose synthase
MSSRKIVILGHKGMVGSAIFRHVAAQDVQAQIIYATKEELDLRNQRETTLYLNHTKPDLLFVAAAKVGGVKYNDEYPVDFLNDNLLIASSVLSAALEASVARLLYLGSSCIYPREADQPMHEEQLLSGKLEKTNQAYALAKIVGLKLCEFYNRQHDTDYRALMPCNLYGPGDSYSENHSHVIPSLIMKMHSAKASGAASVSLWGDGRPMREFLFVDDLADACWKAMSLSHCDWETAKPDNLSFLNVGSGFELSIRDLAYLVADVVGFKGSIKFDVNDLNGVERKLLDSTRFKNLGWEPKTNLKDGLHLAYQDYLRSQ